MQKKIFVNQPLFDNTEINAIQKIIQNGLLSSSNINGGEFVQKFEKQILNNSLGPALGMDILRDNLLPIGIPIVIQQ